MKNPFQALWIKIKSDHRHLVCTIISIISIGFIFLFPNGIPRLAETIRDFGVSLAYYVVEIFVPDNNPIQATVVQMPSWTWADDIWEPLEIFPWSWDEFKILWKTYWPVFLSKETLIGYTEAIGDFIYVLSRLSLPGVPFVAIIIMCLNSYKNKHCTDRKKKSKQLRAYEKFQFKVVYPAVSWCKDFVTFCKEHPGYHHLWLFVWMLHLNVISLFVAFLAYYLYFAASWDIPSLYPQLLKLLIDLAPPIRFIPGITWIILGVIIYNNVCRSMAFVRLRHAESCNRAVLSQRGVLTIIYGEMGIGKTNLVKSMALSAEVEQFDMAFEIMVEKAMMFPNFPWQKYRDHLKKRIADGTLVDSASCRKYIKRCAVFFDRITATYTAQEYREKRKKLKLLKNDYTFGYDYDHYRATYNDNLKITKLYEALEDYACAYLKFTVKTTLLFSNFSIRVDTIIKDLGNMPYRDTDFFDRDPRFQEAYSHHAHIIDFDMLRLGKKLVAENPKAARAPSGVYVISEIDKERKNQLQLKETKINTDEANQKNDLFEACLMMIRHADVISNRTFVRVICDLQRPEAWGAGGRELGEVIYISEKDELMPALPIFSPYWLINYIFKGVKNKWNAYKNELDVNRSDQTLFVYLIHNIVAKISNYYDKIYGLFGMQTFTLEIQSGRMDGEVKKDKWRILSKKDYSRRYKTACLEAVFESYEPNFMHVDDFIEYAGEVGTQEENQLQNSYFQNDIKKMKEQKQ